MKRILVMTLVLIFLMTSLTGCFNTGRFLSTNVTDVRLGEANYEYIALNVTGTSKAGYLFGITRVSGTGLLYQEALENLWGNFEKNHGPRQDKKVALVNVHYDTDIRHYLLYMDVQLFIRADVVEFK